MVRAIELFQDRQRALEVLFRALVISSRFHYDRKIAQSLRDRGAFRTIEFFKDGYRAKKVLLSFLVLAKIAVIIMRPIENSKIVQCGSQPWMIRPQHPLLD